MVDLIARAYQENLTGNASGKLIDLGCGKVPLFQAYSHLVSDIFCADRDDDQHLLCHVDLICDLGSPLPIKDEEFNTIILSDVLEHIPQPEMLWSEMSRVMKPGGKILLNVPFLYWLHEQPHDYLRYSRYSLERYTNRSGLKLILLQPLGGSLEVLTDLIAKHLQAIPLIGILAAICIQEFTYAFSRTRIGKMAISKTSKYFPLGYFMVAEKRSR